MVDDAVPWDVAVVGGGAAGLAAAIFAARRRAGLRIAILDGAKKLGAKILVSGGGRCNVTNAKVEAEDFWGGSRNAIRKALRAFSSDQAVSFFKEIGVDLHEEERGKLFPDSNSARTVLAALLDEAGRRGVRIMTGRRVERIERRDLFEMTAGGERIHARRVVLATGGQSLPKTGSDGGGYQLAVRLGHSLIPPTPALVPLVLQGDFHKELMGVAHDAELAVHVDGAKPLRLAGAMLWTHFGISGPVVLDASRFWHRCRIENRSMTISVSFLPGCDFERAERRLLEIGQSQPRQTLHNALAGWLPVRLGLAILCRTGIDPGTRMSHVSRESRRRLIHALLEWPLPVCDSRGYNYAEVTAGGVPLEEVDPSTMCSRKCPGLYLVGEILDVDGRIGGFNFQWAWSTAWVAACAVATSSE